MCTGAAVAVTNETSPDTGNEENENEISLFEWFDLENVPEQNRKNAELYFNFSNNLRSKENETTADIIEGIVSICVAHSGIQNLIVDLILGTFI